MLNLGVSEQQTKKFVEKMSAINQLSEQYTNLLMVYFFMKINTFKGTYRCYIFSDSSGENGWKQGKRFRAILDSEKGFLQL